MNDYFQENKRSLMILTGLLLLLVIVLYFLFLRPQLTDLSSKEKAIASAEHDIDLLEQQLNNLEYDASDLDIEQSSLENKIPTERKLDDYILFLGQLEAMTGSRINHIELVYDSNLEEVEEIEEEQDQADEDFAAENEEKEDEKSTEETNGKEDEGPSVEPAIINEKPEELQVMTVKLTATAPNFADFIYLLETIENEKRLSIVNKLHFLKPTETDIVFTEDALDSIPFELELITFYYME